MPKSYRLKTKIGVDQSIRVNIEQDFDFLEVLSLKLRQEDVYTRFCADYGVVIGRVVANGGYGIPNANVSVFVPVEGMDLEDPVISSLYPYKSPEEKNEDGFRYNLLPYTQEYGGHTPTGTFPTRQDVISRQEVLEIYDKYYKFSVKTNESGDFMIVGVPLGMQKVVLDLDLSNMGCFSLRPQDLIRMGRGVQDQFNGSQFKSSSDLSSLPQIVNQVKDVDVASFWGQEDLCNIGITRVDFDLRDLNIEIEPTAVFMGSIFSTPDNQMLKKNCKPKTEQGDLCGLVTGPGEVLAIRQTIDVDSNGDPILEQYFLPNGGKVIDDEGTFVTEVPMNLDYIYTNEYGEEVISNDPSIGVPTKSKYRFKVKYQSEENGPPIIDSVFNPIKGEIIRANFVVPQIREYGWTGTTTNPGIDPSTLSNSITSSLTFSDPNEVQSQFIFIPSGTSVEVLTSPDAENVETYVNGQLRTEAWIDFPSSGTLEIRVTKRNNLGTFTPVTLNYVFYDYKYSQFQKSYAFSLDWNEYADKTAGINCDDFFYEMVYNKVYTTAQLIEEYRKGSGRARFLGIKEIIDRGCESTTNKFPTNDGVRNFDFFFFLFDILMTLLSVSFVPLIIIAHVICFLWPILRIVLTVVLSTLFAVVVLICNIINGVAWLFGGSITCPKYSPVVMQKECPLSAIGLPNLSYPDCQACECEEKPAGQNSDNLPEVQDNVSPLIDTNLNTYYGDLVGIRNGEKDKWTKFIYGFQTVMAGNDLYGDEQKSLVPWLNKNDNPQTDKFTWSYDLPLSERFNLFNVKAKYHQYGGQNQIRTYVNPTINNNKYHNDNIIMMVVDPGQLNNFSSGQIITFQNPDNTQDVNVDVTTGTTLFQNSTTTNINITYMDPNSLGYAQKSYIITGETKDHQEYNFASDIEYFQVVTGQTLSNFKQSLSSSAQPLSSYGVPNNTLGQRYVFGWQKVKKRGIINNGGNPDVYPDANQTGGDYFEINVPNIELNSNWEDGAVIFLVRGVDPNTPRQSISYDLSKLYGYSSGQGPIVSGNFKLNIPIQPYQNSTDWRLPRHNKIANNGSTCSDTGLSIYFNSFTFTPNNADYQQYQNRNIKYYSSFDADNYTYYQGSPKFNNSAIQIQNIGSWDSMEIDHSGEYYFNYISDEVVEGGSSYFSKGGNTPDENDWAYSSPVYYKLNPNMSLPMTNSSKLVMRTDRLPTSDVTYKRFQMHQNKKFGVYLVDDQGQSDGLVIGSDPFFDGSEDFQEDGGQVAQAILNTFSCDGMVPLDCYSGNGETIGVYPEGNDCYYIDKSDDIKKMYGGCYYLVTKNFAIVKDFKTYAEWKSRFRMMFALCRNVVSLTFVNNWVNGSLYMYSFQKDDIYGNDPNETKFLTTPEYQFCEDTVVYQQINNSFFYRSSPYNFNSGVFTGKPSPKKNNGNPYPAQNVVLLGSPTTMMDMGPRDQFLQEICFNPDYQGYVIETIKSTSYQDTSDIMQLFAISRLADSNFWQQVFGAGDASIQRLFSRPNSRLDGDIAQMISINSEFGVVPFLGNNYPDANIKYLKSDYSDPNSGPLLGVFFSGNTVNRDLITPGRVTFQDTQTYLSNLYGFRDQEVPFHPWEIKSNTKNGKWVIFGSEENDWRYKTTTNSIDTIKYQTIDRLTSSYTFPSSISTPTTEKPGFIYNSSFSGGTIVLDEETQTNITNMKLLVGAPYHFYFGLRVGKSAMNKYIDKYMFNQEIL